MWALVTIAPWKRENLVESPYSTLIRSRTRNQKTMVEYLIGAIKDVITLELPTRATINLVNVDSPAGGGAKSHTKRASHGSPICIPVWRLQICGWKEFAEWVIGDALHRLLNLVWEMSPTSEFTIMAIMFELKNVMLLTAAHFDPSSSKFASYVASFMLTRFWGWGVCCFLLCLSSFICTFLFTSLSCHFALWGDNHNKTPPVAPYWTPFTEHLTPFLRDPANLFLSIA